MHVCTRMQVLKRSLGVDDEKCERKISVSEYIGIFLCTLYMPH